MERREKVKMPVRWRRRERQKKKKKKKYIERAGVEGGRERGNLRLALLC